MYKKVLTKLKSIFTAHPEIKLVYFFGSKARGDDGPLSDYDFAFYVDGKDKKQIFDLKLILMDEIARALKTDKIDVVMLNLVDRPELKYHIISDGKVIFEKEPFKILTGGARKVLREAHVLIEPRILNEYFDFHSLLLRYHLTKA